MIGYYYKLIYTCLVGWCLVGWFIGWEMHGWEMFSWGMFGWRCISFGSNFFVRGACAQPAAEEWAGANSRTLQVRKFARDSIQIHLPGTRAWSCLASLRPLQIHAHRKRIILYTEQCKITSLESECICIYSAVAEASANSRLGKCVILCGSLYKFTQLESTCICIFPVVAETPANSHLWKCVILYGSLYETTHMESVHLYLCYNGRKLCKFTFLASVLFCMDLYTNSLTFEGHNIVFFMR